MTQPELDRRQALRLLGVGGLGAVVLGGCGGGPSGPTGGSPTTAGAVTTRAPEASSGLTPAAFEGAGACALAPEQTEGPFYLQVDRIREDIREDRQGTRLRVATRVLDTDGCTPIKSAVFEIWHCDAGGLYSGFERASRGAGGLPGPGAGRGTDDERYLRGAQVTDGDGIAAITTIDPGWYPGRTVHIHAKVFITSREVLTTQLYFDDGLTQTVHRSAPYSARGGRDTFNRDDRIFSDRTVLTVRPDGDGYLGLLTIGVAAKRAEGGN